MDQIPHVKGKGLACSDRPTENAPDAAVPLSSTDRFSIFQPISLILQTLPFWFSLTALLNIIYRRSRR